MIRKTVFILMVVSCTRAATLYVDKSIGSDSYNYSQIQSLSTPALTIGRAEDLAQAGDTVEIRAGYYYEKVTVNCVGSAGNWITFQNYNGEEVVIEGTEAITGWTQCSAADPCLAAAGVDHPNYSRLYWAWVDSSTFPSDPRYTLLYEGADFGTYCSEPNTANPFAGDPSQWHDITGGDGETAWFEASNLTQIDDFWIGCTVQVYLYNGNNNTFTHTVEDFDAANDRVFLDPDASFEIETVTRTDKFRFLNHPHIVDGRGEFFVGPVEDNAGTDQRKIFYWPRTPANIETSMRIASRDACISSLTDTGGKYIKVKGLTLRGAKSSIVEISGLDDDNHASYWWFEDLTIYDTGWHGIYSLRVDDVNVLNCTVDRAKQRGIHVSDGVDVKIQGNEVTDTVGTNISVYALTNFTVQQNTMNGITGGHGNGLTLYGYYTGLHDYPTVIDIAWTDTGAIAKNTFNNCNIAMSFCKNLVLYANLVDNDPDPNPLVYGVSVNWTGFDGYIALLNNTFRTNYTCYTLPAACLDPATDQVQSYLINNVIRDLNIQWPYATNGYDDPPDVTAISAGDNGPFAGWYYCTVENRTYNSYIHKLFLQSPTYGFYLNTGEMDHSSTSLNTLFADPTYSTGDWHPLTDGPLDGAGTSLSSIRTTLSLDTTFPDVDFTTDIDGTSWSNPPSIGAYAGSGAAPPPAGEIIIFVN